MSSTGQPQYIHDRLDSLYQIEAQLVSVLDHASQIVNTLQELKQSDTANLRLEFKSSVQHFYTDLQESTHNLRQEIKRMDDAIGSHDAEVTLLPITVNKKASGMEVEKLHELTQ